MLSEDFGGEWSDHPPPIWERLAGAAKDNHDKLALACLHQPSDLYGIDKCGSSYLKWSYRDLITAVDLVSSGLQAQGVGAGSTLACFLGNGAEFVLLFWAAHKLRCTFAPLNARTLQNAEESQHVLTLANVSAVVVGDVDAASIFDGLEIAQTAKPVKILVGGSSLEDWIKFGSLFAADEKIESLRKSAKKTSSSDLVSILFTSGTTSLPKGCPHTDLTLNAFMKNLALGGASPTDTFCGVLPNNHAMGYFYVLHFLCNGGAVVYPSASFDPAAMAKALKDHACTHTCLVPTALHSLLEYIERDELRFPDLQDVCLAGASVTPRNLQQVTDTLGSRGVSTGFGMTEGSPIWTAATSDPSSLVDGDNTISGKASPGTYIRLCEPESTEPVPRGQPGEVHESGPGVIAAYLGQGIGSEQFYTDDKGRTWFRTGDRAIMYPDGRVSIIGRYKDMIIRGGENIAPSVIEGVLNKFPSIEAQVIAAPDPIAGEVPVAVVKKLPGDKKLVNNMHDTVRNKLGPIYVPDEIVSLDSLGQDDFPRTTSGKIQKTLLQNLVVEARTRESSAKTHNDNAAGDKESSETIEKAILHVWWRAAGIEPQSLDKSAPTSNFADSITTLRVRDLYRKELGVTLSSQEMREHSSIGSQIQVLSEKIGSGNKSSVEQQKQRPKGPPSLDELQIIVGPENDATSIQESATLAVGKHGYEWNRDVETVIRTVDFMNVMINTRIIDSWNFAIAVLAEGSTVPELRKGLIAALANNPLWRSFYVHGRNQEQFYITLKSHAALYDNCFTEAGNLKTLEDVQKIAIDYPHREQSTYPGLLFHALLYHVEDLDSAAVVYYVHHSLYDASSMRLVLTDLNQALMKPNEQLRPHLPYDLWSDMYHSLRNSPRASFEVKWHVERLRELHLHRKALYPPANSPRKGNQENPDGLDYGFDAPNLLKLKEQHPDITAAVVIKAAIALINVARTGHTHALFGNSEGARSSFPFWPETLRSLPSADGTTIFDLDASDVAGPTMNGVTNLIEIARDEAALKYLIRLHEDQLELTERSHIPWRRLIEELNSLHPGENAGELVHQSFSAQFLTWVPGFLGDYEKIKVAHIGIRAAIGLVFVAGIGGPQTTTFMMSMRWDISNYSRSETESFVKDVEKAAMWLLDPENWTLPVGEFLKRF